MNTDFHRSCCRPPPIIISQNGWRNHSFGPIVIVIIQCHRHNHRCHHHKHFHHQNTLVVPTTTTIIIIITRPKPGYCRQGLAGLWGQDTDQGGTFWDVLNVSLRASGAQLKYKPTNSNHKNQHGIIKSHLER